MAQEAENAAGRHDQMDIVHRALPTERTRQPNGLNRSLHHADSMV